jgi:hypothetical protein
MDTASAITKKFHPNQPDHVQWMKKLSAAKTSMMNSSIQDQKKHGLKDLMEKNPLGVKINPLEFPIVHMALGFKYCEAVLAGEAYIPS